MKQTLLLILVLTGVTYAATAAQPFTGTALQHQAEVVCGAREAIDTNVPVLRNAGVIKAYKDAVERDANIKVVDGLKDGQCTAETIKQYNSKPAYYASCEKNHLKVGAEVSCSGKS